MEPSSQRLRLRLSFFESVEGNGTLTIGVARKFTTLFNSSSDWDAAVRQVDRLNSQQDEAGLIVAASANLSHPEYELSLVHRTFPQEYNEADEPAIKAAIHALCRDFCDLRGPLNAGEGLNTGGDFSAMVMGEALSTTNLYRGRAVQAGTTILQQGATPVATCVEIWKMFCDFSNIQKKSEVAERRPLVDQAILETNKARTAGMELDKGAQASTTNLLFLKEGVEQVIDTMQTIAQKHDEVRDQAEVSSTLTLLFGSSALLSTGGAALGWSGKLDFMGARAVISTVCTVFAGFASWATKHSHDKAVTSDSDADAMRETQITMHRWFCMVFMEMLRSNYRSRPDAPMFAKLTMEMVAALDPKALDGWDSQTDSLERLGRDLGASVQKWRKSVKQPLQQLQ
ncbi:hypothetical protein F5144DRAFT_598389 [Chaetomium tenue]|uniref:Uncharacterized protein n=1 Tax=Chaetomium tenue TaxID=1854479 RepID=A0ACB7PRB6_9PEZI|nr:hypothetical protein F5144DRAFT_598389 [Chaetomium globosum]